MNQWMNLTNTFFEEAWLCSQREVAAANQLIGYIEKAIADAKEGVSCTRVNDKIMLITHKIVL